MTPAAPPKKRRRSKASRRRAALKGWRNRRRMMEEFKALLGTSGFTVVNEDKRSGLVVARTMDPEARIGYVWRSNYGMQRLR